MGSAELWLGGGVRKVGIKGVESGMRGRGVGVERVGIGGLILRGLRSG